MNGRVGEVYVEGSIVEIDVTDDVDLLYWVPTAVPLRSMLTLCWC